MRDILADAEAHKEDGYGRSQKQQKQQLPKRFYKSVDVIEKTGEFYVQLDGKPIKTPGKKAVAVPSAALAEIVQSEWAAQETEIDPAKMPVTRLVNTIVERADETIDAVKAEIVKFVGNDLMLYRADSPIELVEKQAQLWGDALALFEKRYDVRFEPITGIIYQEQPKELSARINDILSNYGAFSAFATMSLTSITGSGVLAIGIAEGLYAPEAAWENAFLDENYQAQLWGEDAEALRVRKFKRSEYDAALALLAAIERTQ